MARKWTRAERLLALNLYFKVPFGQQHGDNPKIAKLAGKIDRTPNSVAMKLNNFAALDETLDRKGLTNVAKVDEEVWKEYWQNLGELAIVREQIAEQVESAEHSSGDIVKDISRIAERTGESTKTETQTRLGQRFFRNTVLQNYEQKCAVCRLAQPDLVEAAHIIGWEETDDDKLRVNPTNGLALCSIHHTAFDTHHLSIDPDNLTVELTDQLLAEDSRGARHLFQPFENSKLLVPEKFRPDTDLLARRRHNSHN